LWEIILSHAIVEAMSSRDSGLIDGHIPSIPLRSMLGCHARPSGFLCWSLNVAWKLELECGAQSTQGRSVAMAH
jgi:hypothetical protein